MCFYSKELSTGGLNSLKTKLNILSESMHFWLLYQTRIAAGAMFVKAQSFLDIPMKTSINLQSPEALNSSGLSTSGKALQI